MDFTIIINLFTLAALEIVLGVDNLVFIAIASSRLPQHRQKSARRIGLLLALGTRLLLLFSALWIIRLQTPLFSLGPWHFSARDLFLILGGLFLIVKGTMEIHREFESAAPQSKHRQFSSFFAIVTQIAILDIIFSLDSILTAIGMTQNFTIMAIAITIAILVMMLCSEPLSRFIENHPSIRMLALSFLLLIGTILIADGFKQHVPRAYVYCAVCFSMFVETLNTLLARKKKRG
ncbi:MAG: TerC family protein [Gammaproteobacteria bacterium]